MSSRLLALSVAARLVFHLISGFTNLITHKFQPGSYLAIDLRRCQRIGEDFVKPLLLFLPKGDQGSSIVDIEIAV